MPRRLQHQTMVHIRDSINNRQTRLIHRVRRIVTTHPNRQMSHLHQVTSRTRITIISRPRYRRPVLRQQRILVLISHRPTGQQTSQNNRLLMVVRSVTRRRRGIVRVSLSTSHLLPLMHHSSINRALQVRLHQQLATHHQTRTQVIIKHRRQRLHPISLHPSIARLLHVSIHNVNSPSSHPLRILTLIKNRIQRQHLRSIIPRAPRLLRYHEVRHHDNRIITSPRHLRPHTRLHNHLRQRHRNRRLTNVPVPPHTHVNSTANRHTNLTHSNPHSSTRQTIRHNGNQRLHVIRPLGGHLTQYARVLRYNTYPTSTLPT